MTIIDEKMALVFEDLNEIARQVDMLRYELEGADTKLADMVDDREVQRDGAKLQRIASMRLALEAAFSEAGRLKKAVKLFKEGAKLDV